MIAGGPKLSLPMKDQRRYALTPIVLGSVGILWAILLVSAGAVVVVAVRAMLHVNALRTVLGLIGLAMLYAMWNFSAGIAARFITNEAEGYRPWLWGMAPASEFGRSAQEFDIPLSFWQVRDNFKSDVAM